MPPAFSIVSQATTAARSQPRQPRGVITGSSCTQLAEASARSAALSPALGPMGVFAAAPELVVAEPGSTGTARAVPADSSSASAALTRVAPCRERISALLWWFFSVFVVQAVTDVRFLV